MKIILNSGISSGFVGSCTRLIEALSRVLLPGNKVMVVKKIVEYKITKIIRRVNKCKNWI